MSDRALETFKGLRGLLEDILAPTVGRLEVRVAALGERCDRMACEIQENRVAHEALLRDLTAQLASLNARLSRLEGRTDGMKSELTVALQLEILKIAQGFQPMRGLGHTSLPSPEDGP